MKVTMDVEILRPESRAYTKGVIDLRQIAVLLDNTGTIPGAIVYLRSGVMLQIRPAHTFEKLRESWAAAQMLTNA